MGSAEPNARDDSRTRLRENATEVASLLVTGLWLGAMFTGQSWWLAALLVGYVVVVPLVALTVGDETDRREWWDDWSADSSTDQASETKSRERPVDARDDRDALEALRERYAAGELTDEQFERKLEGLLETRTLEDARDRARGRRGERPREQNADHTRAKNRSVEDEP